MAPYSNPNTPPTDISGSLLIGILLSTLLYGVVLGLSFQYLSAMSRIGKLAPKPYPATKSPRPGFVAILRARLKKKVPSFFLADHAFRNFTVLATHMAGSSQTIVRFYILWQLAIVQSRVDLSLNPLVIPFGKTCFSMIGCVRAGLVLSSSLLTLVIQTLVQITLLGRAQKLDKIATYSAALVTERDQNRAMSLSSDSHSIRIEPGEEEDDKWLVDLRHRRLVTHSMYLQEGSSPWQWKALQFLIAICAATGVASVVLNPIGPFERHQGIALSNTSSSMDQTAERVTLITPTWYMLSVVVDVLISASTIRNLGRIRNQVLDLRNNKTDSINGDVGRVSKWCTGYFHHHVFHSTRERVAITLVTVLSTSLKSQESRNCNQLPRDAYHLKSSVNRLHKSSISDPRSERRGGTRPPRSFPAAMIRENSNLSLTYDSSDTRLDCENVLSVDRTSTFHTSPPQLLVSSQSSDPSSISWVTWEARSHDANRLSPNSQLFCLSASTIDSKPEYPLQSKFSDWGTVTPETSSFLSRSTMARSSLHTGSSRSKQRLSN
ncbi:hypothetical protein DFH28DRAFT_1078386 [Melampsora americana]|nr:hypothetical protein DFH28DRAFT_1078386 [Melampsora americana]